jgi:hypothetical protein
VNCAAAGSSGQLTCVVTADYRPKDPAIFVCSVCVRANTQCTGGCVR